MLFEVSGYSIVSKLPAIAGTAGQLIVGRFPPSFCVSVSPSLVPAPMGSHSRIWYSNSPLKMCFQGILGQDSHQWAHPLGDREGFGDELGDSDGHVCPDMCKTDSSWERAV